MHWLRDPGNHGGSLAVQALPKKLRVKLSCHNNQNNRPVGYGVYIIEGYNLGLITMCSLGALFLTLILTLLWCILKKDVQGGTGIGQYAVAVLAVSLTALGLHVRLK